jgi:hypothetical protein
VRTEGTLGFEAGVLDVGRRWNGVALESTNETTPQELSRELCVPGQAIRKYLRTHHSDGHSDYERWRLDAPRAEAVRAYFTTGPDSHSTDELAEWSPWGPFFDVVKTAPSLPGVYMMRSRASREVVYVGRAGGRKGKGLRGRLEVYLRGKGAVSGFGEAALDRALSDVDWMTRRVESLMKSEGVRAKEWAKAAIEHADVEVRWTEFSDEPSSRAFETSVLRALAAEPLWNRQRPKNTDFDSE